MKVMISTPLLIIILISVVSIATLLLRRSLSAAVSVPSEHPRLDKAGVITNWILGILYLPLSLVFFLLGGMASEICMDSMTPVKEVLCAVLSIMALFPVFISAGGILASILLRRKGASLRSFAIQFAGMIYCCVMFLLISLLYLI